MNTIIKSKAKQLAAVALGVAALSSSAMAQSGPLDDLTSSVSTVTGIGTTVAGVAVTLFLIGMAMRFFRKGAR